MLQQIVEKLSNLTPQTVLGIEGVAFVSRALAMPGVEEASTSIDDVPLIGTDADDYIDVTGQMNCRPDIEERMICTDRHLIVGGLCYDHDAVDPMESGCANGKLHRKDDKNSDFGRELGLDGDGNRDLGHEACLDNLAAHVTATIRKDKSLMGELSRALRTQTGSGKWDEVLAAVSDAIYREGWEYAMSYVAEKFVGVKFATDLDDIWKDALAPLSSLLTEGEAEAAWDRAWAAGQIGNPCAVLVDMYEHSVTTCKMAANSHPADVGAVWVPDADAMDNIQYSVLHDLGIDEGSLYAAGWVWKDAVLQVCKANGREMDDVALHAMLRDVAGRYAAGVIEEYSEWLSGNAYGVVCYVIDRASGECIDKHTHECWGHIGYEYAERELDSEVLSTALSLVQPSH